MLLLHGPNDESRCGHGARYHAKHTFACRRSAFPVHYHFFSAMRFFPGEIMMVLYPCQQLSAYGFDQPFMDLVWQADA